MTKDRLIIGFVALVLVLIVVLIVIALIISNSSSSMFYLLELELVNYCRIIRMDVDLDTEGCRGWAAILLIDDNWFTIVQNCIDSNEHYSAEMHRCLEQIGLPSPIEGF